MRESDEIESERRDRIDEIAGANYNKERDYREQVRQKELARTLLVAGSLATLLVSNVCKVFGKGVVGVKGATSYCCPKCVGRWKSLHGEGALLKGKFRRKNLILVQNEKLRNKIEMSSLNTIEEFELVEYIQSSMMLRSVTPTCDDCRGGCKTQSCPCRVARFTCGAHCHKAYYTRHRTCANYK